MSSNFISKSVQCHSTPLESMSGPYMQTLPGSFSLLSLSPQHSLLFGMQRLQPLDLRSRLPALPQQL